MSLFDEKTTAKEPRAWVSGLRENQSVDGVYLVVGKSLRYTRSGNAFLALELRDRTDRIQARLWENAEVLEAKVQLDSFVRVVGQVVKFNETLQVNVTELEVVPEDSVDKADFLPTTERDIAEMDREFDSLADCVRSPHLRLLVGSFREDSEFWKLFRQAPAAKQIHHAVIGGLLEHTLSVAR
ncbi:MAG: phosphohydrolase, partial [Bacillota bacterium]